MMIRPTILIVEDNEELAEITCELFAGAGLTAIYRTSIADALQVLAREAGAILFLMTDINLESPMTGIELAVYAAEEWPNVALCVTSGFAHERPRRLPDKAVFLSKPWRNDELMALARDACNVV